MKTLAIGVIAAVLSSPCFGGGASFPADVHCNRFDVFTYAPIWMRNIWRSECGSGHKERYEEIWSRFEALGKAGARVGAFSDGLVRIAMRKGRTRIYVDHEMNGLLIDRAGWHFFSYCIPCDHVPVRSWALFKAKDLMRELFLNLKAEPRLASFPA